MVCWFKSNRVDRMINIYLFIAFVAFVINGIAYNISIYRNDEDPSLKKIFRIAFIYALMALVWPIELFYISKLLYKEIKNGQSN